MKASRQKFAMLHGAQRVWAVSSIHGEVERLQALHRALGPKLDRGDRLVYLGNMIGRGPDVGRTMDELVRFRRLFLSMRNTFCDDICYLRGSQEEMWQKLLQLQFASDPRAVVLWMLSQGMEATLEAYSSSAQDCQRVSGSGPVQLTRWTGELRRAMQARPGHYELTVILRRAAYTTDGSLLFVNAGLDPARPLETQKDSFWWGAAGFDRMSQRYGDYRRVVRGFSQEHPGVRVTEFTATVDGGCGFGGPLQAVCIRPDGEIVDQLEV